MKIFDKKNVACFLIIIVSLFIVMPGFVMAAGENNYNNYGLIDTVGVSDDLANALDASNIDSGATTIPILIGKLVGVVLSFVGVIFFILVIYGGFLWMTARGDSGQVDIAKNLLYAAIIGLIIVLAAYAITSFIGGQVTGT